MTEPCKNLKSRVCQTMPDLAPTCGNGAFCVCRGGMCVTVTPPSAGDNAAQNGADGGDFRTLRAMRDDIQNKNAYGARVKVGDAKDNVVQRRDVHEQGARGARVKVGDAKDNVVQRRDVHEQGARGARVRGGDVKHGDSCDRGGVRGTPKEKPYFLKPCPFCGHEGVRGTHHGRCYIVCAHCAVQTKRYGSIKYAVTAWNKRRK